MSSKSAIGIMIAFGTFVASIIGVVLLAQLTSTAGKSEVSRALYTLERYAANVPTSTLVRRKTKVANPMGFDASRDIGIACATPYGKGEICEMLRAALNEIDDAENTYDSDKIRTAKEMIGQMRKRLGK